MAVSYNKLWKLLIDKGITKTEMRKRAGLSTNVLAKMGKNETVSMETLARIAAVMECGLDDIVERNAENGGNEGWLEIAICICHGQIRQMNFIRNFP